MSRPPLSLMRDAQVGGRRKKEEEEENWRESMSRIFGGGVGVL